MSNESLNIYQKLTKARNLLLAEELKKSATNGFAKFKYMELTDIIPITEKICEEVGILIVTKFTPNLAISTVHDHDSDKTIKFTSPFNIELATGKITGAQGVGALHTYFRRYMLMLVFEIMEHDAIDSQEPNNLPSKKTKKQVDVKTIENDVKTINNLKKNFTKIVKENNLTQEEIKSVTNGKNSQSMSLTDWNEVTKNLYDLLEVKSGI